MRFGTLGLGIFVVVTAACSALRTGPGADEGGGDRTTEPEDPTTSSNGGPNATSSSSGQLPNNNNKDGGGGIDPDGGGVIPSDGGTLNVKIQSITVGENVACVVYVNGEMRCWGDYRLAGAGSTSTPKPSPIPIRQGDGGGFLVGVAEVSASYRHACARLFSGNFACWGFNNEYQLGDFTRDINQSTTVTPFARLVKDASVKGPMLRGVQNFAGVGRVSGGVAYSAAITELDGAVMTWGFLSGTDNLVLGRGDPTQTDAITPKPVQAPLITGTPIPLDDRLLGAKNVDLARTHGCAALSTNKVACWGDNSSGKLGVGNGVLISDGRPRIVSVPDGVGLLKVSVGDTSACALTAMNRVRCWGQNNQGQSGKASSTSSQYDASLDVVVADPLGGSDKALEDVIDIGVGDSFACALVSAAAGGKVYCWGTSDGSVLGDGSIVDRAKASPVSSELVPVKKDLVGARLLAVGDSSACVVLGDHEARCWGQGPLGERGESSSTSSIPRIVDDL
jgi:alpha-tubulin suppressor-like RCC1 family protein